MGIANSGTSVDSYAEEALRHRPPLAQSQTQEIQRLGFMQSRNIRHPGAPEAHLQGCFYEDYTGFPFNER